MGKAAAGNVATGYIHGEYPLAQTNTGSHLRFKFLHTVSLGQSKGGNLPVSELEIFLYAFGNRSNQSFLLFFTENKIAFPLVEFAGELANSFFFALLDIGKNLEDDIAGFLAVLFSTFDGFFQKFHEFSSLRE